MHDLERLACAIADTLQALISVTSDQKRRPLILVTGN